jgi:integrase
MWVEKNGPTYRIRDVVRGKKTTVKSGFPTKTAAKKVMTVLEGEKLTGTYIEPSAGQMLLVDWAISWWRTHQVKLQPASVKSEGARLRNHIVPLLGDYQLGDVTRLVVRDWVVCLLSGAASIGADEPEPGEEPARRPLAEKTIRNAHGVLYAMMQDAVDNRLIRGNPCYRTGLPRVRFREQRYLDEAEIGRLVEATPTHWRPQVVLMLSTGLRWSEAAGLRVKNVDVLARTLRVEETRHELSGGSPLVIGPPKTAHSRRTVTYPPEVAALIVPLVSMRHRDAHLFTAADGTELRQRKFWKGVWLRATMAAGLEGLRIHDMRHTHASHLIADNVPLTGIQRRLGHSSITVTSDMYGHLLPVVDTNIIAATTRSLSKVDFSGGVGGTIGESNTEKLGATLIRTDVIPAQRMS